MSRPKFKLKIFGLCALVVGTMALGTGVAQAETGAFWQVNGAKLSETLLPTVVAAAGLHITLLSKLGGKSFHILCLSIEKKETHLVAPAGELGFLRLTACTFLELKEGVTVTLSACEPHQGEEKGVIVTKKAKGLIVLNAAKEGVVKFEPETGTTFATISMSSKCAFGENLSIGGSVAFKDGQKKFTEELETHLLEFDSTASHLWVLSDTAEHAATIDGFANTKLSGAHAGLKFSGKPA